MTDSTPNKVNPLTIYENIDKLYQYLPAGVYTAASIVAGIITPTGECSSTERTWFWIVIVGVFTAASCIISGIMHRTVPNPPPKTLTFLRVVGVAVIYIALTFLTTPGSSCLAPNEDTPSDPLDTEIPSNFSASVLAALVVGTAGVIQMYPDLVSKNDVVEKDNAKDGTDKDGNDNDGTDKDGTDNDGTNPTTKDEAKPDKNKTTVSATVVKQVTNKLTEYVPASVYSFYILLCTYLLSGSGQCKGWQSQSLIFIIVVGCFVAGFNTLHFSSTTTITMLNVQPKKEKSDYIRAVCAAVAFLLLALFTPPGSTCVIGFVGNNWNSRAGSIALLILYTAGTVIGYVYSRTKKLDSRKTE